MNKYIKENCKLNKDSIDWALIKTSAFFKEEFRMEQAEVEIIDSYVICMNIICEQIKKDLREKMQVLRTYSLCIPYIFICRQLIELMLKRAIECKIGGIKIGHRISNLWVDCKNIYKEKRLDYYDELIETIENLDPNGQKYRYVKDTNGNEFENKTYFLNVELIKVDVNRLKKELF